MEQGGMLNDDVLLSILIKTKGKDLISLCSVNRRLRRICNSSNLLWKVKIAEDFGENVIKLIEEKQERELIECGALTESYKQYYIDLYNGRNKPHLPGAKHSIKINIIYSNLGPTGTMGYLILATKLYLISIQSTYADMVSDIVRDYPSVGYVTVRQVIIHYKAGSPWITINFATPIPLHNLLTDNKESDKFKCLYLLFYFRMSELDFVVY